MATQAFLDAFRQGGVGLRHIMLFAVPRDDGLATDYLYLSDSEVGTLGGVVPGVGLGKFWQSAVLDFGPISCPGAFCGTSVPLCTSSVTLNADKQVMLGSSGTASTLRDMLRTHVMTNALATIYRMIPTLAGADDAQMLGEYRVISFELDGSDLRLQLRQRTEWNKSIAPRYVNKQEYPRSPDEAVGLGLPIIYGAVSGLPLRRPWPSQYGTDYHALERMRGSRRAANAMFVDAGRGSGVATNPAAKVLVAGHKCKSIVDTAIGSMVFIQTGDSLSALVASGGNIVNTATEAGILLPDDFSFAWLALKPSEILALASAVQNPRHVLLPNEKTFAFADYAAGFRELQARVESPSNPGDPIEMELVLGYSSGASVTGPLFSLVGESAGLAGPIWVTIPASQTPTVRSYITAFTGWGSNNFWPTTPWDYQGRVLRFTWDLINFPASCAGKIKIFFIGALIRYRPRQDVVQTERHTGEYRTVQRQAPSPWVGARLKSYFSPYREPVILPAETELRGKFYCNVQGQEDDGSGTYTGTASALIERLPDIVRHLLVTYGAESAANIETGAATLGSFVAARAVLIDERGTDLKFALSISSSTDMMATLAGLCSGGLAMPHISPYDNKWRMIVWRAAPPITYPWKFSRWDVADEMGPKVEHTPLPDLLTGVRVAYGYNAFTRSYDSEVALSHNRSVAGYEYFGLRDQQLTVTASVNDRLNFKETWSGATIYTMTLTAGDYATPHLLAKHITARIRVAAPNDHLVSVCNVIEEGFNDRLRYWDPTDRYAGIKPGTYTTMEALRREALRALNQSSSIAGCSYASGQRIITPASAAVLDFLMAGQPIGGTGIPGGATIASVGATTFTISADTTAVGSGVTLTAYFVASWASGGTTVTLANPAWSAKFTRGMRVVAAGIAVTGVITTVNDVTGVLTVSVANTSAGNNVNVQSLSSTGSQWLLRYTGGKFGVSKTAGTLTVPGFVVSAHAARLDNAWGVLGFSRILADVTVPTTPTYANADDVRFEDHLCLISLESTTDILIASGADGQDSATAVRHCGDLLGTSGESDILQSLDAAHGMTCFFTPKGSREIALRKTAARYGARRDVEIEGRAIYDTRTALSLRNRIADLLGKPRSIITFNTTKAPDIERGDVFEFRDDINDLIPYPGLGSDGLWTGKRFIVTDVTHHLGPSSRDTTIVAVDVTD